MMRLPKMAPTFAVTTRHAQTLYPWQLGSPLPASGPVIGLDLLAGHVAFHYDPFELYARRMLTSPNMVVLGQLGKGKSSLVKTHLHRQLLHGRQAFVLDPKGEYGTLAELHGIPHLRLGPGSTDRLNPLDPHAGDTPEQTHRRRAQTIDALAAVGLGRDLTPEERAAISVAVADLPPDALLGHLIARLLNPPVDLARALSTTEMALATEVRPVALELRRLLDGDLAGLLDAPTTHRLDPNGPGLVLDLSSVFTTPALAAVMVCAGAWLSRTLTTPPSTGRTRQRLLLLDEAWAVLHLPATTTWLQALSKLARAHGVQLITVVHRASDLAAQADSGTATQARARGLLADAETRVLYTQSAGERTLLTELLELTDVETDLLTQLPPHRALWQIGTHRAVVHHQLSQLERAQLIDTDQHMRPAQAGASPWLEASWGDAASRESTQVPS
jgi:type IV secretory pathway VirB4 component